MHSATVQRRKFTPPEIGRMLGVTAEKVIGWIKSGQLRAVNLSNGAQRPRYRIDLDDLARFECSRAVGKQSPRPRRRRRPEPSSEIWFP